MKKILSLIFTVSLLFTFGYLFFEPEIIKGDTDDTQIKVTVTGEININCSTTVSFSGNIGGQSGGNASTTFGCTIETNDTDGYNLQIEKDGLLHLDGESGTDKQFSDYSTSTTPIDYEWNYVNTAAEEFGFCVNSGTAADVVQRYKDNGSACDQGGGSVNSWHCWDILPNTASSTPRQVVDRTSGATPAGGLNTEFGIQVDVGSGNNLQHGDYYCTTTATATAN